MAARRVLLGVFAHPDDESFGSGGTLAKYAAEGADVHVIIATDGIAGSVEEGTNLQSHESLAQLRSGELANAAVRLGLKSIWSLPYRDSGMRGTPTNDHPDALVQQPVATIVHELLQYFQLLQPQVVITHDPWGGYGHPDHIRVCEAVSAAFHLSPYGEKLYYTAIDKRWMKFLVRLMPLWGVDPTAIGRNKDINLIEIASWETPVHATLDVGPYLPIKVAASEAHVSQYSGGPMWVTKLPASLKQRLMGSESFSRAYPPPNGAVERDLFAGVS